MHAKMRVLHIPKTNFTSRTKEKRNEKEKGRKVVSYILIEIVPAVIGWITNLLLRLADHNSNNNRGMLPHQHHPSSQKHTPYKNESILFSRCHDALWVTYIEDYD